MPIDPLSLSAIISGVVSLGSTAVNTIRSNRAANREHQNQLAQWHRENEYNTPLEQRKRFQEAGMNPSAVVGEVASGATAGALSSVPSDDYAKGGILPHASIVDTLKSLAEVENIATNTDSVTSDIALKSLEYILKQSGITGSDLENIKKKLEIERIKEENKWTPQNIEARLQNIIADTRYKNTMSDDTLATQSVRVDKLTAESDLIRAQKLLSEAQTDESRASAKQSLSSAYLNYIRAEYEQADSISLRQLNKANYEEKQQIVRELQATYMARVQEQLSKAKISASQAEIAEFEKQLKEAVEQLATGSPLDLKKNLEALAMLMANFIADVSAQDILK